MQAPGQALTEGGKDRAVPPTHTLTHRPSLSSADGERPTTPVGSPTCSAEAAAATLLGAPPLPQSKACPLQVLVSGGSSQAQGVPTCGFGLRSPAALRPPPCWSQAGGWSAGQHTAHLWGPRGTVVRQLPHLI